jgi:hypothetical protein
MDSCKATDGFLKNARHARFSIRESETYPDLLLKNQVLAHKTLRRDYPWPPSLDCSSTACEWPMDCDLKLTGNQNSGWRYRHMDQPAAMQAHCFSMKSIV